MTQRTYTIPLRRSFRNTEPYRRTKKAVSTVREFLQKHMKTEEVKIGSSINLALWERGGKNPPAKISIVCEKRDDVVFAELEGVDLPKSEVEEAEEKPAKKAAKTEKKENKKAEETSEEKKSEDKPAKKASEKKSSEKSE